MTLDGGEGDGAVRWQHDGKVGGVGEGSARLQARTRRDPATSGVKFYCCNDRVPECSVNPAEIVSAEHSGQTGIGKQHGEHNSA